MPRSYLRWRRADKHALTAHPLPRQNPSLRLQLRCGVPSPRSQRLAAHLAPSLPLVELAKLPRESEMLFRLAKLQWGRPQMDRRPTANRATQSNAETRHRYAFFDPLELRRRDSRRWAV